MTLDWIEIPKRRPYFTTTRGESWTPIGHNDAIPWASLSGLFRRTDPASAERYLAMLAAEGVTVLRVMLEYCEFDDHYLENPIGHFNPDIVQFWDDFIPMCGRHGVRLLLTPWDTFWMWNRWDAHPYNRRNGGPCEDRTRLLLDPETRKAMKARLEFAARRWSGSGVVFAWDVYNEIHPSHAGNSAEVFDAFVTDLSTFLREVEIREHGRSHPQTVSVFGPHIALDPARISECVFRHPCLDFASAHIYEEGTIDFPWNTVDAAVSMARLVREAISELRDGRPFLDSESGPIHSYKDWNITLDADYDEEVFRHMQWAHFASGGAGGGMRWPNRQPHVLTPGMHRAQRGLARFVNLIDWRVFERRNLNEEARVSDGNIALAACGDEAQAVVWLLRKQWVYQGRLEENARGCPLPRDAEPVTASVTVPGMRAGRYRVTAWNTHRGCAAAEFGVENAGNGELCFDTPGIVTDMAFAVRRVDE